jgi:predicted  nucleic acid-binding Zn-ribbon protein
VTALDYDREELEQEMERSRTEHADEISELEQARSRLEGEIARLAAFEAEAEALRAEVDSLRKVESMAIEGVERLEDQVDEAEARCERTEAELRAKVAEAVEARGRAARSEEALKQQQQSAAAKEKEGGVIQREQQAREAKLREEVKLAKREIEMMQEMASSLPKHQALPPAPSSTYSSTKPNTQASNPSTGTSPSTRSQPQPLPQPDPIPTLTRHPHAAPSPLSARWAQRRAKVRALLPGWRRRCAPSYGRSSSDETRWGRRSGLSQQLASAPAGTSPRASAGLGRSHALTHPKAAATVREGWWPRNAPHLAPHHAPHLAPHHAPHLAPHHAPHHAPHLASQEVLRLTSEATRLGCEVEAGRKEVAQARAEKEEAKGRAEALQRDHARLHAELEDLRSEMTTSRQKVATAPLTTPHTLSHTLSVLPTQPHPPYLSRH